MTTYYIGEDFSTYADAERVELETGRGDALVLMLEDNSSAADFLRSLSSQCDYALRDLGEVSAASRLLWDMLRSTERDRALRGDIDAEGDSDIQPRGWNARERRGAAYRQGYIDAIRDAREAIERDYRRERGAH